MWIQEGRAKSSELSLGVFQHLEIRKRKRIEKIRLSRASKLKSGEWTDFQKHKWVYFKKKGLIKCC